MRGLASPARRHRLVSRAGGRPSAGFGFLVSELFRQLQAFRSQRILHRGQQQVLRAGDGVGHGPDFPGRPGAAAYLVAAPGAPDRRRGTARVGAPCVVNEPVTVMISLPARFQCLPDLVLPGLC
jgi:hypothetical protein